MNSSDNASTMPQNVPSDSIAAKPPLDRFTEEILAMRLPTTSWILVLAVLWSSTSFVRAESKLEEAAGLPEGLSKEIASVVDAKGQRVIDKSGAVCSVWLAKEVPTKANFKPTLNVKYPFAPGELLGVLQVQAKSKYTDFRGQEIKAGVYTLRLRPTTGGRQSRRHQRSGRFLVGDPRCGGY